MEHNGKISGALLVDKPSGMTSHDVVDRIRVIAGIRRVGHIGTLDPMAKGLLVLCLGGATSIVQFLMGLPKVYTGTIKLGAVSSTYDAEGAIMAQSQPLPRDEQTIRHAMRELTGDRVQLAPPYSAVKVRGKKLYEYAREGLEAPQKPRKVRIYSFEIEDYCEPEIRFLARVGSGTYIRSMAHDLGARLGCGAYLSALRRQSIGSFHVDAAARLKDLEAAPDMLAERLLGLPQALAHLPTLTISPEIEPKILNGAAFTSRDIHSCEQIPRPMETTLVLNTRGEALSVARGEALNEDAASLAEEKSTGMRPLRFRPLRVLAASG